MAEMSKYKYRVVSGHGASGGEVCSEWATRAEALTAASKLILAGFPRIEIRRGCFLLDVYVSHRHQSARRLYAAVHRKADATTAA